MRSDVWLASLAGVVIGSWLTLIAVQVEEHSFGPNRVETEADNQAAVTASMETAKADAISATTAPARTPADAANQEPTPAAEAKPDDKISAPPAVAAEQTPSAAATAPSTTDPGTIGNGNQSPPTTLSSTASASPPTVAPTSTPEDTAKALLATSADQIDSGNADAQPPKRADSKASTEFAQRKTTPANPGETQLAQAAPTNTTPTPQSEKTQADNVAAKPAPSDRTNAGQIPAGRGPADQGDREQAAAAHRTLPGQWPTQQVQASPSTDQKPSEQAKPVELVRPFSDRAGILTIAGKSVQLPGIIPTDVDRMCTGPSGKSWPCGAAARTAFRMYLRGRTIDCDLPSPTWKGTVIGACRYVRIDLSEWLVRFGWAEPEAGSPLSALAEQAKQQKRGIYGDDPRAGGKSTLAPDVPKENPLNPI
ncbi:hypothetical protein PY650_04530 [Rhizobium calliandrae]|uniref:Thermonuclease family protein n=1 Tax=Rhizobium calliandrae TaxID=1312182 RepID=A0ABT7K8K0_9HYPH|nr:hypothetical protein [Rhizobium calliandrae]MDL2404937.1 hypothetical protein [Rhizobium calliandrae]